MPEFRIRRPTSIVDSLRTLVTSTPNMTASDHAAIDSHVAQVGHRMALADKARQEVEALRTEQQFRSDPENALTYAAMQSGLPLPIARQVRDYMTGAEGAARPDITPEQDRAFRSFMSAVIANRLGTGKTNADQLTHAGGRGVDTMLVNRAAEISNAGEQAPVLAAAGRKPREPFGQPTREGLVVNQETGGVNVGNPDLFKAVVAASQALTGQRNAAAGASGARTRLTNREIEVDLPGARASQADAAAAASRAMAGVRQGDVAAGGPQARADASRARGDAAGAKADSARAENDLRKQSETRTRFGRDPDMKGSGNKLGNWVPGKGFEVRTKDGKLIGHYD